MNFLPPGQGRTPQQVAAAERLRAAVAARAREQVEAARAQQHTGLAAVPEETVHQLAEEGEAGHAQPPGPEQYQGHDLHPQQVQHEAATVHQGGFPGVLLDPMLMPTFAHPQTYQQFMSPAPFSAPPNTGELQDHAAETTQQPLSNSDNTVHTHTGDSIFNQMMNDLIASGRAENESYRQVRLPLDRAVPFGREFLYYAEWLGPEHWLADRAVQRWSALRAVRNARTADLVGWQDSHASRPGGIYLFPTENLGRWASGGGEAGASSRGR